MNTILRRWWRGGPRRVSTAHPPPSSRGPGELSGRGAFDAVFARELGRAKRYRHSLSLLIIGIDGTGAGAAPDAAELVRTSVGRLPGARAVDQAFQFSAHTFALLCPHASPVGARRSVAERLRHTLRLVAEAERRPDGNLLRASLGVATYPADGQEAAVLLRRAEAAAAAARTAGGDQVVGWSELPAAENGRVLEEIWHDLALGDLTGLERIRAYLEGEGRLGEVTERRRLGQRLAGYLGCSELEAHALQGSLLLYDVGRIGVLDAIWEKPGPLSLAERRIVETHPVVGASLLKDHPPTAALIPAVLYHHERFDGTGYPLGLKGAEIPLLARLVHGVDAYLAMTRDRPYRRSLGRTRAVQELWRGAGTQFDPQVVEALAASG